MVPGERVVLDLRPHARVLVRPLAAVPLLAGAAAFGVAVVPTWSVQPWVRLGVVVVALLLAARWCLRPYLRWSSRRVVVTTERIVLRDGLFARSGRDVPLHRVVDVRFVTSGRERLFRSGTLIVDTTADEGRIVLRDVPRVERVQRTVADLADRSARRQPQPAR